MQNDTHGEKKALSIKPYMLNGILDWAKKSGLSPSLIAMPGEDWLAPEQLKDGKPKSFSLTNESAGGFSLTGSGVSFLTNVRDIGVRHLFISTETWIGVRIKETGQFFDMAFPERAENGRTVWDDGLVKMAPAANRRAKLTVVCNDPQPWVGGDRRVPDPD